MPEETEMPQDQDTPQPDGAQNTETPGNQEPTEGQSAGSITFTSEQQKAVDKIVADRLQRAEAGWTQKQQQAQTEAERAKKLKELEEAKEYETLLSTLKSDNQTLAEVAKKHQADYETLVGIVSDGIEKQIKALDKPTQFLVSKLPLTEQIAFLNEFGEKTPQKRTAPKTNAGDASTGKKANSMIDDVKRKYGFR